jgi:hypothetical protein
VLMAWQNGRSSADGLESFLWGFGFAGATIGSWFVPAIARTTTRGLACMLWPLFLLGTALVLVNAIAYTAKHRDRGVGSARSAIEAHDLAQRDHKRLSGELDAMKPNPRWVKTSGCSDITVAKSDAYCSEVKRIQGELAKASATLALPRPISADPQAERLGMVLAAAPETVADWLPIFFAVALDLLATGFITAAFAPIRYPVAARFGLALRRAGEWQADAAGQGLRFQYRWPKAEALSQARGELLT